MYTPSMANQIVTTHESGFDMAGLVSNISLVKDHPALWGYCKHCHPLVLRYFTYVAAQIGPILHCDLSVSSHLFVSLLW